MTSQLDQIRRGKWGNSEINPHCGVKAVDYEASDLSESVVIERFVQRGVHLECSHDYSPPWL